MYKTLELLKTHKCLGEHKILDYKQGRDFYYLKVEARLKDGSILYIREYVSSEDYINSYHWQDINGKLIIRWDNAPHHKNLDSFPHHKHTPKIEASKEVTLEDVLVTIESKLDEMS